MTTAATCDELRLADAVLARLNALAAAGEFSQTFEAQGRLRPGRLIHELAALCVTVVPGDSEETPANRGKVWSECTVAVGIQKLLAGNPDEKELEGRALLDLFQEIRDVLRLGFGELQAAWIGTTRGPKFIDDQFEGHHVFTKACLLKYRMPGGR